MVLGRVRSAASCFQRWRQQHLAAVAAGLTGSALAWLLAASPAAAFTASKVWSELLPTGIYRVHVTYTVPELKEFRESHIEFRRQQDAEAFYWDLLRGADFYPTDPKLRRFIQPDLKPDPW